MATDNLDESELDMHSEAWLHFFLCLSPQVVEITTRYETLIETYLFPTFFLIFSRPILLYSAGLSICQHPISLGNKIPASDPQEHKHRRCQTPVRLVETTTSGCREGRRISRCIRWVSIDVKPKFG